MAPENSSTSEQSANRSWRIWATTIVVGIAVLAAIVGFVVVPAGTDGGMAEAMGEAEERDDGWQDTIAGTMPPTDVAWTVETLAVLRNGDSDNGAVLAEQRCASCHGVDGISASPAFPSLAGQPASAVYKQLRDFASGHRASAMMVGMVQGLEEQDFIDLASFYASLDRPPWDAPTQNDTAEVETIAFVGDMSRGLPACESCHAQNGPRGTPNLKGLPATYIATQLRAFDTGERANDIYGLMRTVSQMLTSEEIDQLALFYGPPIP